MKRGWISALVFSLGFWCVSAPAVAAPKGKLILGMAGEPTTFDPHIITSPPQNTTFPLVFDTLLSRDKTGKIVPWLATSHRLVRPTLWEFKLRDGVKFTNGEPADAHAVKFSLERIINPKTKSRQISFFRSISHVEVVDQRTAQIHTKYPDMFLSTVLAQYGQIVPPKYYQGHDMKYLAANPVGSGPYRLVRWKKGEELIFEASPSYRDASKIRIKTGIVKIIPEPTTRVAALVAGDIDIAEDVPPQLTPLVKSKPGLEVISDKSPRVCYVLMVIKPGAPWANVLVRKALNYVKDVDSIVKHVLQGYGRKVATNLGPNSFGHNPNLKPYPYDPQLAQKLLAEAGYEQGFSVDMYVPIGRYLMGKEAAEAVAGQFAKAGVKVRIRAVEWANLTKIMSARWEPHAQPYWWYSCRLDTTLHAEGMYAGTIHSKSTWGGFRDPEVDKVIDAARSEPDEAKREKKYQELDRLLHEEKLPLVFLYLQDQIAAKKTRVDWQMRPDTLVLISEAGWKE